MPADCSPVSCKTSSPDQLMKRCVDALLMAEKITGNVDSVRDRLYGSHPVCPDEKQIEPVSVEEAVGRTVSRLNDINIEIIDILNRL